MNILKVQDTLKNLSDAQLAQEIRMPSGAAPQFLVMTEMQRRQKMRAAAQSGEERPSIAEEMAGEAAPAQMPPPEGQPPAEPQPQAAGIMGLPDSTAAGNVMRARITGQPQQVGNMTALPPQGMAGGGAVQFGNIFGDMGGNAGAQSSGTPELMKQNYMPTNGYVAPSTTDYSNFRHQFDGRPTPHTPNPRVRSSPYAGLDLPKGMAMPTEGTAGLVRNMSNSMRNPQFTGYSWASPEHRDAYIRYMTPPTTTTQAKTMASGGPAHFDGTRGSYVYGGPETSAAQDWWKGFFANPYPVESLERLPPSIRSKEIQRILEMQEGEGPFASRPADNPNYIQQTRKAYEDLLARSEAEAEAARNDTMFPFIYKRGELDRMKAAREAALAKAQAINPAFPSREVGAPQPAAPQTAAPNAAPVQLDINQNYNPDAPEPSLMPSGIGMAAPNLDFNTAALMAAQNAAKPKAKGSIAPSDEGPVKQEAPGQVGGENAPIVPKSKYEELAMEKLNALRGDAAADRQNDINMALMQAGLGMAASKNRNFLGALAEGASPALSGFTEARRLAKKDARELTASELGILANVENIRSQEATRAEQARQFGETLGLSREQLDIQRRSLNKPTDIEREYELYTRDPEAYRNMKAAGKSNDTMEIIERMSSDPAFAAAVKQYTGKGLLDLSDAIKGQTAIVNDVTTPAPEKAAARQQIDVMTDAIMRAAGIDVPATRTRGLSPEDVKVAVTALRGRGASPEQIIKQLVARGVDAAAVEQALSGAQ